MPSVWSEELTAAELRATPPGPDWPPIRRSDVLERLSEWIGSPLVCLDGPTGRCLTESHSGTLLCVPAVCLRRLSDIHEPEVLELSDGLLAFVGPLPGSPERQLRFAGVALSARGGRPGELVLAAIEAGWSTERLDDWILRLPVMSSCVLARLVRLAVGYEEHSARIESKTQELEVLGRQNDAAWRQISLLHALTPHLQVSECPEHLAAECIEKLGPLVPAECHVICLEQQGCEPLLLIDGQLPFDDAGLLRLISRYESHDWSTPLIRNQTSDGTLAAAFPGLRSFLAASIRTGDVCRGWIVSCNALAGPGFGPIDAKLLGSIATVLATHLNNIQLYCENDDLLLGFVKSLVSMLDARDPYTRGHSERVALVARQLGRGLGLSDEELELIYVSGLLHDIGKLGIDDQLLRKPAPLTREEFRAVQQHPVLGCQILGPLRKLKGVLPGVRSHHEFWNGTGYPDGLQGEQIPLVARIIAVADAFDAITSDRPYRAGMSLESLEQIFREGDGRQWDPRVIAAYFVQASAIQQLCRSYSPDAGNLLRDPITARDVSPPRSVLRQ